MRSYRIPEGLAILVSMVGAIVMIGWIFDVEILKSILPVWVTMKATTAIAFILSGVTVYCIARSQQKSSSVASVILPITTMVILLLMVTHLSASCLGLRLGLSRLFVREPEGAMMSVIPGRPSVATMSEFILIAIAGVLTMLKLANLKKWLLFLGWLVVLIGAVAVTGYILRAPALYYYIEDISTAMAFHTSILFVLTGISLILVGKQELNQGERICQ